MSIFRGPAKVTAIESKDGVFNNGNATVGLGRGRWWALAERIFSTVRIPSPAVPRSTVTFRFGAKIKATTFFTGDCRDFDGLYGNQKKRRGPVKGD